MTDEEIGKLRQAIVSGYIEATEKLVSIETLFDKAVKAVTEPEKFEPMEFEIEELPEDRSQLFTSSNGGSTFAAITYNSTSRHRKAFRALHHQANMAGKLYRWMKKHQERWPGNDDGDGPDSQQTRDTIITEFESGPQESEA